MENSFFLVFLLLILGFALPYLIFLIRNLRNILPYLYLNARISAKEGCLLKADVFDEMIGAGSIAEIASILENTEYANAMQGLVLDRAEGIEHLLIRQTAEVYNEIAKMLPQKIAQVFRFLLQKWDISNLTTVIRGVRSGRPAEEILSKIIPVGELDLELVKKMVEAGTIEDLLPLFEGTPYESLTAMLPAYEQGQNLLVLESLLHKIVLETMWQHVIADRELMVLRPEFSARIDALNLKIMLRAKRDHLLLSDIEQHLIDGGEIKDGLQRAFNEVDEIGALLAEIEGSPFYKPLIDVLPEYESTGSLFLLEKTVEETALFIGKQTAVKHPYGVAPILGYLSLKETEVKNIRAIARAKEMGVPPENIRSFTVRI